MTRIRGLRGNLKSRSIGLFDVIAACDRLAAGRDLHDAPVNAYTWQRSRPTALIHLRDRRCPDTLRRDPPIRCPDGRRGMTQEQVNRVCQTTAGADRGPG